MFFSIIAQKTNLLLDWNAMPNSSSTVLAFEKLVEGLCGVFLISHQAAADAEHIAINPVRL